MSRKPDARSIINGMTPAQRDKLDGWLFEKNFSYSAITRKCKSEFGVVVHRTVIARYYEKTSRKRALEQITSSARYAKAVMSKFKAATPRTFEALVAVIGQMAFESSINPKAKTNLRELKQWIEMYLATRKDDREAARFAFDRERWEVDVARLCFEHHAELQKISANPKLDEDARLLAIRHRLFGPILPK